MATCRRWLLLTFVVICIQEILSVDRNNFKTCQQSSFCRRHRSKHPGRSDYDLLLNTLQLKPSSIEAELLNTKNQVKLKFELYALVDSTFRLKINEVNPIKPRYEVEYALDGEPELDALILKDRSGEAVTVASGSNKVVITGSPFRVDFYSGDELVISVNSRGLFKFEHLRQRKAIIESQDNVEPEANAAQDDAAPPEAAQPVEEDEVGMWEEDFKSHKDSKPRGPESVGMDISFIGAKHVYGIPEHADSFALKQTTNTDPFRLYNLDVFEYELNNPMALYGSVPVMVAHSAKTTVGVMWLNAAETWVDVQDGPDQNVVSSLVNLVSGSATTPQVDTRWMSESGIVDAFFMLGPKPKDVFRQNAKLSGVHPLPQYFTLGYHQCRWNYNDQDDVRKVDAGFDEHDIPFDVIWLDIEYTDGKKYFTWDTAKFPNPLEMVQNLTARGRKLVVIIDPHIKRDGGYFFHNDAETNHFYVQNKDRKDYEGWCWPGAASYPDFFDPLVREYYKSRYGKEYFIGDTDDVHIWNDMNEPSVFNGPEVTMPKDCIHHEDLEHREIHNLYALLHVMSTHEGLLLRNNAESRPFILTRGHFIGTQRYAAVWTGDNMAEWGHLQISIPMCLSLSVVGIPFCGADIGGFFRNVEPELFVRWYQAGVFQPFFRSHSHIDTKRREPWLFDENIKNHIRDALRLRYSYLPLWYSLFREHELTGMPVMRPLWVEFPNDANTFGIDNAHLLGRELMVHPVTEQGATSVTVYFPGKNTLWYDMDTYYAIDGLQSLTVPVTLSKIPLYQQGGTIVPKKERVRRSSSLTHDDPYTFVVALDRLNYANGSLYIDDGQSYEYQNGQYLHLNLEYSKDKLTSKFRDPKAHYPTKTWLERVVVLGMSQTPIKVELESKSTGKKSLDFTFNPKHKVLVIRKPAVSLAEEWSISLV